MASGRALHRCWILLLVTAFALLPLPAHAADGEEIDVAAFEQLLQTHLASDLTLDLQPFYDARPRTVTYAACAGSHAAFASLSELVSGQLIACANGAAVQIETLLDGRMGWAVQTELPYDWRMWACLYKQFRYQLDETLTAHVQVRVVENEELDIILSLPEPDTLFAVRGDGFVFQSWMDYSNLKTLYDEDGTLLTYRMPALPAAYAGTLVFPLDDTYIANLKDTWYQGRSRGTRKHMGTDIKANRKATIRSCSDGEVAAVGYNGVGGYYVAVRDDYGYLYLYFHMFKNSQMVTAGARVTAGQPIGLVGNTGNSETDHLHLGIVAPDWTYVNAYQVMSSVAAFSQLEPAGLPPYGRRIG